MSNQLAIPSVTCLPAPLPLFPLEIIVYIGAVDMQSWHSMLAVPTFARWTLSSHARKLRKEFLTMTIINKEITYYLGKKIHNFDDLPAVIWADRSQHWYKNGELHRDNDKPAIIRPDGSKHWYQNGKLHRDNDKPATIPADGTQRWYQNGLQHRDNGPAEIRANGTHMWIQNDKLHRDNDEPAIIWASGIQEWYQNGIRIKKI